ncbi:LamG domain-containing protein [Azospirillum sp. TSO22-1]|uniref:LamG domain-containing protein n=1 Tax=Azospirillum sp. TSO22-1 TaxID=716789 RepID=UPI001304A33D|nr:LamG domain-containing protein [Azospirillum sp. TSO22-1]
MPAIHDDRTPTLGLPLPHQDNELSDDVQRIREAVTGLDAHAQAVGLGVGALQDASAKVRVSAGDTAPGTLDAKLAAGTNITLTRVNAGGNEQYRIDSQPGSTINQSAPTYVGSGQTATLTGQSVAAAYEQIAGQAFNLTYNTEADYIQENAATGTDLSGGAFVLHNAAGAVIDSNTKLLIHADGVNGDTAIVDERGITPFGTHCMYLTDDAYFNIPKSYKLAFGTTQDFTIETWVRPETAPPMGEGYVFDLRDTNTGDTRGAAYMSYNYSTGKFSTGGIAGMIASATSAVQTWHHVAVVRYNGTRTLYVDGVSVGSAVDTTNYTNSQIWFGKPTGPGPNGYSLNGWLSNFRVSKVARYTAAFTRPTVEFTRDSDTVYLFKGCDGHGSQLIRDDSRSGHDVRLINSGCTISTARAKFGTSSAVMDGSPGTGISIDDNKPHNDFQLGSDDFTIDTWVYPTSFGTGAILFAIGPVSANLSLRCTHDSSGQVRLSAASSNSGYDIANGTVFGTLTLNAWNHVAITRSGTSLRGFVGGVLGTTASAGTNTITRGSPYVTIGRYADNTTPNFAGNVDEFRVKRGVAEWTSTFTPPTSAHTTDDRTILLLHFDGANGDKVTLDSSESSYGNNVFGDTTTPTWQLMWNSTPQTSLSSTFTRGGHGTSLRLDGTQWAVLTYAQPSTGHPMYFASGEQFCIEGWVYLSAVTSVTLFTYGGAVNTASAAYLRLDFVSGVPTLVYGNGSGNLATGPSVSTGWNHIAAVREGRGWVVYSNGVAGTPANPATYFTHASEAHTLWLGTNFALNGFISGAIDSFRITHGKPRYQTNFTPGNLTQDDDTALLWVFDGSVGQRWVKELSKNTALIQATNARTVKDGVWLTSVNDGSANMPVVKTDQLKFGTGGMHMQGGITACVKMPISALGTPLQAWAIDFWVRPGSTNTYDFPFYWGTGNNADNVMFFQINPITGGVRSCGLSWQTNSTGSITGPSPANLTAGAWSHVAVNRSADGTTRFFVNGTLIGSGTSSTINYVAGTSVMRIGVAGAGADTRIDEMRISMGTDRGWTGSTITVPTMAYGQQYVTGPYYVTTSNTSHIDLSAFSSIDNVTVAETINPGTTIKYLTSFDGRTTWKSWNGSAWVSAALGNIETVGNTSTDLKTGLLAWSPALGTTIDVAASLKTSNPAFTPALDNITVTMDEYQMLQPVADYTVRRKKANGVQTLVFTRVKAGNANHVFDVVS